MGIEKTFELSLEEKNDSEISELLTQEKVDLSDLKESIVEQIESNDKKVIEGLPYADADGEIFPGAYDAFSSGIPEVMLEESKREIRESIV